MNAIGNLLLNTRRGCLGHWDGSNPAGWTLGFSTEVIVAGAITGATAFTTGETVVQTSTGASGTQLNQAPGINLDYPGPPTYYGIYQGPLALAYPLTGPPPDATHTWVGQSSGAVFTPSSPGYLNPTTAFWQSGSVSPHINASFIGSLQFDFILQTTGSGNENWFEIQFGNDSSGNGPALVLTKNYFSSPCGFIIASTWGTLTDPYIGVTNPTFTKDVWHTIKITLDGSGNASWYLDTVLQATANVGEPSQGTYIGFTGYYGNNWITNICSR